VLNVTFGTHNVSNYHKLSRFVGKPHQFYAHMKINEMTLKRSYDKRLEHINLNLILEFQFEFMIKIFGSMLAERKIVFLSSKLRWVAYFDQLKQRQTDTLIFFQLIKVYYPEQYKHLKHCYIRLVGHTRLYPYCQVIWLKCARPRHHI
jgi:hypothetical protein